MAKVSIIIPSRNEELLTKTVEDIFLKAKGDFEVIVVLDGPTQYAIPPERSNLSFIVKAQPQGLRSAINDAAARATGKYLLKVDAHCMFAEGFDEILKDDCEDNWVVIPRRYTLNPETWDIKERADVDYYYLSCPWNSPNYFMFRIIPWISEGKRRKDISIDDTMSLQGSLWFMSSHHFHQNLKGMHVGYKSVATEPLEIGMKTWLGGGAIKVNKKTWYAHLHKAHLPANYHTGSGETINDFVRWSHYWAENQWSQRVHDFQWLVEKFWPLPTKVRISHGEKYVWPEDWRKHYESR